MTKRSKKAHDFSVTAFQVVQEATEGKPEPKGETPASKRGKARASKLSPERRKETARKAAQKRWRCQS